MRAFTVVWIGQVVSLLGTAMSGFALTIWAWQATGSPEALALVGFFRFAPEIALSPVAGALVDRWNRKLVMALSDLAAGLATIAVLALYSAGQLQIWHLFVTGAFTGAFQAFQWPAYSASISLMIPKEHYVRANSMMTVAESGSGILAPLMAPALLAIIQVGGILAIDIVTFVFALFMLMLVPIPQPPVTKAGAQGRGNLLTESVYGFRYIFARPSLLGLQLVFFAGNLMSALGYTVMAPMILARTGSNALTLGSVESAAAVGGVVGAVGLSAWGGFKRRVHGVLLGHFLAGVLGQFLFGLARSLPVWLVASFCGSLIIPLINGSNQAIWQAKVAPDVQGRVFSVRRLIAQVSAPISMVLAGVLAQRVFEPSLMPGGPLVGLFGALVGTGPGAGMSLLIALSGLAVALSGLAGYAVPAVRNAETILPDFHAEVPAAEPGEAPAGEAEGSAETAAAG